MFIADIGINHNGDLRTALELIYQAKVNGVDVVKFQKRNPDVCVPEDQKGIVKDTVLGKMTYIEYKHKMEFTKEQYDVINGYCKTLGIDWTVSVWDFDSLEFAMQYDLPFIKIPSACLTHYELLKACARTGKPLVVSTGMSTEEEIIKAVETIRLEGYIGELCVLLCNSSYPSNDCELNLRYLDTLKELFPFTSCVC